LNITQASLDATLDIDAILTMGDAIPDEASPTPEDSKHEQVVTSFVR
jgi:hypothetical protein